MAEEISDPLALLRATEPQRRPQAIASMIAAGITLARIEEYLDWLDAMPEEQIEGPSDPARSA
jgi:hypothetical protein